MSINTSFGLNLGVLSFDLAKKLIKDSDEVRVSITTLPEENKQAFTIPARKMKDSNLSFLVNVNIPRSDIPDDFVSAGTETIIIVIRKKSFFYNDPIIASTFIPVKDFPKNLSQPAITKTINIYEPKLKTEKNKSNSKYNNSMLNKDQQILGKMDIKMSLTDPCHLTEFDNTQMNDLTNNSIFDDSELTYDDIRYKDRYFGFHMLNK